MLVRILQKPCDSDVLFERLPPSWLCRKMGSMATCTDSNDVQLLLVGLEARQGNFIGANESCKASAARFHICRHGEQ